jgi:hypothetical protein
VGCVKGGAQGPEGSGGSSGSSAADGSGLPCDVDTVLAQNCLECHGAPPAFGAPMSLVTHADVQAPSPSYPGQKIYQRIGVRIHDAQSPMPQPPNPALDTADTATLDTWIAAGAPAGSCSSTGSDAGIDTGPPLDCTPDLHVAPASAYAVPSSGEAYVCYGLDVTVTSPRQVIAFSPRIDARAVVHHVSLLQSDTSVSSTPTPCPPLGAEGTWKPIYGWTPGVTNFEMPPEAGFPLTGTTHYVVQVHYSNTAGLAGQMDASGFELCSTSTLRPNDADVMAFGTTTFSIPPFGTLDITCDVEVPLYGDTTHLIAALPHMHELGKTISTQAYPGGLGPPVDLGTVPNWNFNRQSWLQIDDTLKPGDLVATRCAWINPTAAAVGFGESTSDEMCYSFTMYYPKIVDPSWSWVLPALDSVCGTTP